MRKESFYISLVYTWFDEIPRIRIFKEIIQGFEIYGLESNLSTYI
jgi:hypothetical protein